MYDEVLPAILRLQREIILSASLLVHMCVFPQLWCINWKTLATCLMHHGGGKKTLI